MTNQANANSIAINFQKLLSTEQKACIQVLATCLNQTQLVAIKQRFLGRKSLVIQAFKNLTPELKKTFSQTFLTWKTTISKLCNQTSKNFESTLKTVFFTDDLVKNFYQFHNQKRTLKSLTWNPSIGSWHPVSMIMKDLHIFFQSMRFRFFHVQELSTVVDNFITLNISENHPAYDLNSCFFSDAKTVLRTHTTNFTSHMLKQYYPQFPNQNFFAYTIGNVYRNDTDDATHVPKFTQLDACMWGQNLNLAKLKGFLLAMIKSLFKFAVQCRFRTNYFPFTEPSLEVDLKCFDCTGNNCSMCKGSQWIEILGAGIVHREVLANCAIKNHPVILAFGLGIERLAMLKYKIKDIRDLNQKIWIQQDYDVL